MEPFRDNEDFKGAVMDIQNNQNGKTKKVVGKETAVLTHFYYIMVETCNVRESPHVRVFYGPNQKP